MEKDVLISRKAAIDALTYQNIEKNFDSVCDGEIYRTKRAAQRVIANVPAVDAVLVIHGRWVYEDSDPMTMPCSNCNYRVFRYNNTPFCPNCGADMREVTKRNEDR